MDKMPSNLGLHSGPPRYSSEEAVREQLRQAPKVLEPSIATRLAQRSRATTAENLSESNPRGGSIATEGSVEFSDG